jgi:predicted ATPase with chaperone activity
MAHQSHTSEATCRCCGAVLPTIHTAQRIDQMPGNEHTKRALEVALTGGFSIALLGRGSNYPDALAFAQIARQHGLTAYCLAPCPCGNYGDGHRACTCTPAQITRMYARKNYQAALQAAIHVEIATSHEARAGKLRRGEPDERILERIAEVHKCPLPEPSQHDGASDRLMIAAIRQLDLSSSAISQAWQLAAVIAQLARCSTIGAAHLAEAVQYRGRRAVKHQSVG